MEHGVAGLVVNYNTFIKNKDKNCSGAQVSFFFEKMAQIF